MGGWMDVVIVQDRKVSVRGRGSITYYYLKSECVGEIIQCSTATRAKTERRAVRTTYGITEQAESVADVESSQVRGREMWRHSLGENRSGRAASERRHGILELTKGLIVRGIARTRRNVLEIFEGREAAVVSDCMSGTHRRSRRLHEERLRIRGRRGKRGVDRAQLLPVRRERLCGAARRVCGRAVAIAVGGG